MKKHRWWMIALSIVSAFILILLGKEIGSGLVASAETSDEFVFYFPLIAKNHPPITLGDAWTGDIDRQPKDNYYFDDTITYVSRGMNHFDEATDVHLNWVQENDCGSTEIFTDTVSLTPGEWTHAYTSTVPSCEGIYTNTVTMVFGSFTTSLVTNFEASIPSVELTDAWTGDESQNPKDAFFFGDPISYVAEGISNEAETISVDITWEQENACGVSEIYTTTLSLASGPWTHIYTSTVPDCAGRVFQPFPLHRDHPAIGK